MGAATAAGTAGTCTFSREGNLGRPGPSLDCQEKLWCVGARHLMHRIKASSLAEASGLWHLTHLNLQTPSPARGRL